LAAIVITGDTPPAQCTDAGHFQRWARNAPDVGSRNYGAREIQGAQHGQPLPPGAGAWKAEVLGKPERPAPGEQKVLECAANPYISNL
jgi:hypothetical protein